MKARDVLLVLAGGAVALVIAAIVMLAVDGDTAMAPTPTIAPTPTAYQRQLTGAEAIALLTEAFFEKEFGFYARRLEAKRNFDPEDCRQSLPDVFCQPPDPDTTDVLTALEDCEVVDFNEVSRDWIINCSVFSENYVTGARTEPQETWTFRFSDETGEWEVL